MGKSKVKKAAKDSEGINNLGELLAPLTEGLKFPEMPATAAVMEAEPEIQEEKAEMPYLLVAFTTGADPFISLQADPRGVKKSKGQDHNITVAIGPSTGQYWRKEWQGKFEFSKLKLHHARLGQMEEERVDGRYTGVLVPKDVRPFRNYHYQCVCGAKPELISSLHPAYFCLNPKCRRKFDPVVKHEHFRDLVKARTAVLARESGKCAIRPIPGSEDIVQVQVGGHTVSALKDQVMVRQGQSVAKGQFLVSGFSEIRPLFDARAGAEMEEQIQLAMQDKVEKKREDILPQLVGVFPKGKAPGKYAVQSDIEAELLAKMMLDGYERELRPYRMLIGWPNLVCDWRWLIRPVSVGWVKVNDLYQAGINADEIGQWNPGFRHELIFPDSKRHKSRKRG